jgi:hypothetical protein
VLHSIAFPVVSEWYQYYPDIRLILSFTGLPSSLSVALQFPVSVTSICQSLILTAPSFLNFLKAMNGETSALLLAHTWATNANSGRSMWERMRTGSAHYPVSGA